MSTKLVPSSIVEASWNRRVSDIHRATIYDPAKSVSKRIIGPRWASLPAVFATFVVSGLMHELLYYHITHRFPTWKVTWGTLKAPTDNASTIGVDHWISFQFVQRLIITGGGTFDGQGASAWPYNTCDKDPHCPALPVTLRFDFVNKSTINHITSINSKNAHINIFASHDIKIQNVTLSAPADSPNTDGIKIADSTGIQISDSNIGTGDDCVAMLPGVENINISNVNCGPGHGFSIGSLGGKPNEKNVTHITIRNSNLTGTLCGLRIKTRPMPYSSIVSDLTFENINVNNVTNPILIDQNYCPSHKCKQGESRVQIEEARFRNIRGSSFSKIAVNLQCSKSTPCEKIELRDININYRGGKATSSCSNCKGVAFGVQNPPPCILKD
ncbi:Glycoside hydrolase, family 28 [Corchorus olitorius]|uniref:Glycoside hydrolase, family 28 n=1 Tax=Corchorus olitorius TaxID=93759 RepID=A0A1R3KB33_9ROSI|nr:Glycoside hydrolase, family 28 [Corchorus olitorius]